MTSSFLRESLFAHVPPKTPYENLFQGWVRVELWCDALCVVCKERESERERVRLSEWLTEWLTEWLSWWLNKLYGCFGSLFVVLKEQLRSPYENIVRMEHSNFQRRQSRKRTFLYMRWGMIIMRMILFDTISQMTFFRLKEMNNDSNTTNYYGW